MRPADSFGERQNKLNGILQKNLAALSLKNDELAKKLSMYILSDAPSLVQENGGFNIIYKDKYVHNRQNPLGEAREVFAGAQNDPVSIHLIYGLGLGYLFQVAAINSQGTVILYEPDMNILWTAFSLVDFSADILRKNVYVVSNYDELYEVMYQKSGMKNSPQLLSIPSQREYDPDGFEELVTKLQEAVGSFMLDLKFTKEKFYPSLLMLLKNIPHLVKETPLAYFKDAYKGKTAVVVSAGPTLDRNIETLKKNRDKYILFVVGTALKTVVANGLKPDFVCIIEMYNSLRQLENVDLSDINFITEPYSYPELRNCSFKNIYAHISANSPINHWWAEITGENIEEYWSKGTVSYTALNCARLLGCSKIILVGQDLAYIGGQCYSKDSSYKDLVCELNKDSGRWEITAKDFEKFASAISSAESPEERAEIAKRRLRNLNGSLYYVKGIKGDMLPTESVYAAFVTPLSQYAHHFNDRHYINTSLVGAQIDGFENMPLEDALKDSEPVGEVTLTSDFSYDLEKIKSNLERSLNELNESLEYIEQGKKLVQNLKNEMKRDKNAGLEVLKSLKKVSLNYLELSGKFADKSKLFDYISTADKIDLDYEMKMTREFSAENVRNISEKILNFYNGNHDRVLEVNSYIGRYVNEGFDTEG